jgi:hypothetical protein
MATGRDGYALLQFVATLGRISASGKSVPRQE